MDAKHSRCQLGFMGRESQAVREDRQLGELAGCVVRTAHHYMEGLVPSHHVMGFYPCISLIYVYVKLYLLLNFLYI